MSSPKYKNTTELMPEKATIRYLVSIIEGSLVHEVEIDREFIPITDTNGKIVDYAHQGIKAITFRIDEEDE